MRDEFEEFIDLDGDELKKLREDGETMEDILDSQNIDEDEIEEFLEEQAEEKVDFITDERDLGDDQVETLMERVTNKIKNLLSR